MNQVTITLPLPSKSLSPNARVHWARKSKAAKAYRWLAREETRVELGAKRVSWIAATVQPRFYFKDARRRDGDNLLASLKSAFDGIADAGLVANDADFTYLPVRIAKDAKNPRVELTITKMLNTEGAGDE